MSREVVPDDLPSSYRMIVQCTAIMPASWDGSIGRLGSQLESMDLLIKFSLPVGGSKVEEERRYLRRFFFCVMFCPWFGLHKEGMYC